jgi:hypothetical protein
MDKVEIIQRFSGSEKNSRLADKARYIIFKRDIDYFCNKYGISFLSKKKILLRRRLSLFIRHL